MLLFEGYFLFEKIIETCIDTRKINKQKADYNKSAFCLCEIF